MKKYLLIVCALIFSIAANAQGKAGKQQAKAMKYAELATEEFSLDETKKNAVYEIKLEQQKEIMGLAKKKKSGELTQEEFKAKQKEVNKSYAPKLADAIGVSKKELNAFNKKAKEAMKKK
ncbi:hypothetical protein [Flammeovirga pacifica]|uniref:EF-hand domain-containing protein n=1 Tax=Flammeovirga pacifica TaxID=915059 RepID=A0A1S1Z0I7_FLAPC|nr:hypothetical protein [Flammeovirga pacifica]OHX66779.1 hypothetical protein NH26_10630 [Flammeovirga pacifica]